MPNIETCLNCLNDIDEQTLYAEGMVLSSHIMWSDKVSMVLEALQSSADTEDCEEFIQEAKSVGTGITVSKGDSLLKRVWDFIRRLVRSIINKISDVLTKLKIRNYEYVEIPMDKSLVEKDLDTINSIYTDLAMDILGTLIDSMSSDNDTKYDTDKVNKLIQRVSTLNILKGIDDGKRHGVKPNEFMTLRDKIRYIDKSSKELLKRTETILKDIERKSSEKNPANPKETEFMKKVQKLATDVSNATTKLFASFKFGSINKTRKMDKEVDVKIKNLKKHVDELSDLINDDKKKNVNESYYDSEYISIEDLEYIDETKKPYEAYLKKHDYDPKTNTLEINGKRMNAGKMSSKKERNRINRFLRENNYDPKTETIETDIKNKDGSNKRIKFNMHKDQFGFMGPAYHVHPNVTGPELNESEESINVKASELGVKPKESNNLFKHEEGHAYQAAQGNAGRTMVSALADAPYYSPSNENKDKTSKFISDKNSDSEHLNQSELDADLYAISHNPYAKKTDKNAIESGAANRLEKRAKKEIKTIGRHERHDAKNNIIDDLEFKCRSTKRILTMCEKTLEDLYNVLSKDDEYIKNNTFMESRDKVIDEIKNLQNDIPEYKKDIEKLETRINELKEMDDIKGTDEYKEYENELNKTIKDAIDLLNNRLKIIRDESQIRKQFLDENREQSGSKARKLEGRQGKHKGKK